MNEDKDDKPDHTDTMSVTPKPGSVHYYIMTPVLVPDPTQLRIATAALITCACCGETIDGMGGPQPEALCVVCHDVFTQPLPPETGKLRDWLRSQGLLNESDDAAEG